MSGGVLEEADLECVEIMLNIGCGGLIIVIGGMRKL
jgi:hypothetical protein